MPISPSPVIQGYMGAGQEQAPMNAEQMFEKSFADAAFDNLRAKFPQLMNLVVTFKVLDCAVNTGSAFGAFVLSSGDVIRYVPAVMSGGSVTSCEMLYNKESDLFEPLTQESVKSFVSGGRLGLGTTMRGDARVEDTRDLMRSMVRPPASSNVVLAADGTSKVAALPDECKDKVRAWLNENHDSLSKIAEVYDVRILSEKLAACGKKSKKKKAACGVCKKAEVLDLQSVDRETVLGLNAEERSLLARDGFLVKRASVAVDGAGDAVTSEAPSPTNASGAPKKSEEGAVTASLSDFNEACETDLGLEQIDTVYYGFGDAAVQRAEALTCGRDGFSFVPVVFAGGNAFFKGGAFLERNGLLGPESKKYGVVARNATADVLDFDLRDCGALDVHELEKRAEQIKYTMRVIPVYKTKSGAWNAYSDTPVVRFDNRTTFTKVNGDVFISLRTYGGLDEIQVTGTITHGCIRTDRRAMFPNTTLFFIIPDEFESLDCQPKGVVRNFEELRRLVLHVGTPLRVVTDGVSFDISDKKSGRHETALGKVAAARYLVDTYGLDHAQTNLVLNNRDTVLFNKTAFYQPQINPATGLEMPAMPARPVPVRPVLVQPAPTQPAPGYGTVPGMTQPQAVAPMPVQSFNPAPIQYAADLGDPDMIDTGILASFAQDPDIKGLLVDYLPDFTNMLDRLGRVILLFCIGKDELEHAYGTERYANVLGSCRKMFKLLGDTTDSLKRYVHMA